VITHYVSSITWDTHTIVPRQRGFFGTPFPAEHGVIRGDIISPTIFNIVIDCVLHHWYWSMQNSNHPMTTLWFYADDGLLAGDNAVSLQFGVNAITWLFLTFGLQLNGPKTKTMISFPKPPSTALPQQACQHWITGQGPTYLQHQCTMINCPKCNKSIQQGNLIQHLKQVHKELPNQEPLQPDPNLIDSAINRLLYITSIPDPTIPSTCPMCYSHHIASRHALSLQPLTPVQSPCHPWRRIPTQMSKMSTSSCNIARHNLTKCCNLGMAHEEYWQSEHDQPAILATSFTVNDTTIETVPAFKYLGRWLRYNNDDLHQRAAYGKFEYRS